MRPAGEELELRCIDGLDSLSFRIRFYKHCYEARFSDSPGIILPLPVVSGSVPFVFASSMLADVFGKAPGHYFDESSCRSLPGDPPPGEGLREER